MFAKMKDSKLVSWADEFKFFVVLLLRSNLTKRITQRDEIEKEHSFQIYSRYF